MILQKISTFYTLILTLSATALHASLLRPQSLGSESTLLEQLSDPGAQSYPWRGCELTGPIYPGGDQLPSADRLFDSDEAFEKQIARLQAVVEVDSVCYDDLRDIGLDDRWKPFEKLGNRLEENYPLMHQDKRVSLERINTFGLVYTLEGEDDHGLKPILFTAHQDVVPVGDEADWTYPPFSATYDGEWMWGRGVADDKNRLTAIMSVFESLLSFNEWRPRRTFVIALGFDEECSGLRGARNISDYLYNRYEENGIEAIIDEGGLGMIELGPTLYALPGVAEKGFVNVWLELQTLGGHSSIPPAHTGIGIMSEIITTLEANPYEPMVIQDSPIHKSLICLARYSPFAFPELTYLIKHNDLDTLAYVIADMSLSTRALIQTTQAVDVIWGGDKINSLPEVTKVGVNYRVAPQNSVLEIQHKVLKSVDHIIRKFGLDVHAYEGDVEFHRYLASVEETHLLQPPRDIKYGGTLIVEADKKFEGAGVSPENTEAWRIFAGTIESTFGVPGRRVVPTGVIMTGNTDSKHYLGLSENIYRWNPHPATDIENFHAVDERLRVGAHMDVVKFYYNLVRNFDGRRGPHLNENQQEL